jgi:DNA-binding protein H-NS
MREVEKLNEQIAKLQAERDNAMLRERDDVLAKIRDQIKAYGFKTSDFKYVLATRKKRGTVANKPAIKKVGK